jgi:hypothetical protein
MMAMTIISSISVNPDTFFHVRVPSLESDGGEKQKMRQAAPSVAHVPECSMALCTPRFDFTQSQGVGIMNFIFFRFCAVRFTAARGAGDFLS